MTLDELFKAEADFESAKLKRLNKTKIMENSEKREKLIERWTDIVKAVLVADVTLFPKWKERLLEAKTSDDGETRTKIGEAYARAVAEEIVFGGCLKFEDE